MATAENIIRELAGPLEAEARRGFTDISVIGMSVSFYAAAWSEKALKTISDSEAQVLCIKIREILTDYAGCDITNRKLKVAGAQRLLKQLGERVVGDGPQKITKPACQKKHVSDKSNGSVPWLDQLWEQANRKRPALKHALDKLGITTNRDLLYHIPRDYIPLKLIGDLQDGERAAVIADARQREETVVRQSRGSRLLRCALEVSDGSGKAWITSFVKIPRMGVKSKALQNSPLALNYPSGAWLFLEGVVQRAGRVIVIQYSSSERVNDKDEFIYGGFAPIYPLSEGVYQGQMRTAIRRLLLAMPKELPDPLSKNLRERYHLSNLTQALRDIHWPSSERVCDQAKRRLAFEELLVLQLALIQRRREIQQPGGGISMPPKGDIAALLESVLPFSLTRAQQRVIAEIASGMALDLPMCRLVQGDVGSGKTVVAAAALMIAASNGYQGALMAPTELLAEQHYLVLSRMLQSFGLSVELLTGSVRGREREQSYQRIAEGIAQVIVGTQALVQEGVQFHRLGLVIADEQHRFGVRQRAELRTKGKQPDMLVMTATPIPRTLALSLYGDLEMSILDEMPLGRKKIKTLWIPLQRQQEAYVILREQVAAGRQGYVVCPLIEESENLQAEAASKLASELQNNLLPDLRIGLLHGAMKLAERAAVMDSFRAGKIDVLAATTVVEVGVDVPNATVMLILNAERFGLSQLHQLRGRVGRGGQDSFCILLSDRRHDPTGRLALGGDESLALTRRRLQALIEESDGFAIAEQDLVLRGPGEFYGTRQHGIPDFRLARMASEVDILEAAREAAAWLLDQDPRLEQIENKELCKNVNALRARMAEAAA